ncbi:MAG: hypothetical protein L3V56_11115 [Candidatus Magnetoovum sp. WYHC-5]|nr:hypothetical protein [Candidatus Magnetoovum sp. WYHC-5]
MLSLKEYVEILLRYKYTIMLAFLFTVVAPFLFIFKYSSVYKASAQLKIIYRDSGSQYYTNMPDRIGIFEYVEDSKVDDTFFDLVKNPIAVEKVIRMVGLVDDEGKYLRYDDVLISSMLNLFLKDEGLGVSLTDSGAEIIEINGYSKEVNKAVDIANAATNAFIDLNAQIFKERARDALGAFNKRIAAVNRQIEKLETEKFNVLSKNFIVDISLERELALTKYYDYLQLYHTSVTSFAKSKESLEIVNEIIRSIPELQLASKEVDRNTIIDSYKNQILTFETSLKKLLVDVKEKHPDVVALKEQIKTVQDAIKEEQGRVLSKETTSRNSYHTELMKRKYDAKIDLEVLKIEQQSLTTLLNNSKTKLIKLQEVSLSLQELTRNLTALNEEYTQLQGGIDRVKALLEMKPSNVSVLNYASTDFMDVESPYFPDKKKILAFLLFLWFSISFAIILLLEGMDKTIRSLFDARETYPMFSVLAGIPTGRFKRKRFNSEKVKRAVWNIITGIRAGNNAEVPRITLFMGVSDGVGASRLSMLYAAELSGIGKKVLFFDYCQAFSSIKGGSSDIRSVIKPGSINGLYECSLKDIKVNNVLTENIVDTFAGLDYDYIVVDTPPLIKYNDALLAARAVSAVVVVAEACKTVKEDVNVAIKILMDESFKQSGKKLWIVINQV